MKLTESKTYNLELSEDERLDLCIMLSSLHGYESNTEVKDKILAFLKDLKSSLFGQDVKSSYKDWSAPDTTYSTPYPALNPKLCKGD